MLDDMLAETPAAPAQPVVEAPAPATDPYTAAPAAAPQPYQSAPAMTRPAAETTQSSFTVPRQGEAARVQVSTAVGNSAGAPIHTPPCAAKADPNAMRLPTSEEQPPEPYCYPSLNLFNATRPDDEAGAAREMKKNADILVNTLDSFGRQDDDARHLPRPVRHPV